MAIEKVYNNGSWESTDGHTFLTNSPASDVSMGSNTWVTLTSISSLDASALYWVDGQVAYYAGSSAAHSPFVRLYANGSSQAFLSFNVESTAVRYLKVSGFITGAVSVTLQANTETSKHGATAGASLTYIKAVKIR